MLDFAPASSKALAESYSQFVPGNAGINTFGVAIDKDDFNLFSVLTKLIFFILSLTSNALVGNIGSKVSSNLAYSSFKDILSFLIRILGPSIVLPATL